MKRPRADRVGMSLVTLVAMSMFASSCFRHSVETRQLPTTAFLRLGNFQPGDVVTAMGDREYRFIVEGAADTLYEVEQGRYRVQVVGGDVVKASRVIYVAAGETKEIAR